MSLEKSDISTKICPCCGFQIDREEISIFASPMKLEYLGAGYPLFYNWLKCCIILLVILFIGSEGYNLITNYYGNDCKSDNNGDATICKLNYVTKFTLANKLSNLEQYKMQTRLCAISYGLIMITLMIFRKIQRKINVEIDQHQLTPSDYTIIVKNIPVGLKNFNYTEEIRALFETSAVPGENIHIQKINLIYDISDILKIDKEMDSAIASKKEALKKNGFRINHVDIQKLDYEFELLKEKKALVCKEMRDEYKNFIGIALISLANEQGI